MYLIPDKFTNLNNCTLKIGAEILKILFEKEKNRIRYDELYRELKINYGEDTGYVLPPALNFLFLLNKIKYKIKGDFVELIK